MKLNLTKSLKSFYFNFTMESKGILFIALFNFQSLVLQKNIYVYKHKGLFVLIVRKGKKFYQKRYFASERVGTISYWKGLERRASYISSSYFLDEINFESNDLVVDCGANVGDLALFFQLNNLQIRYIGYEPSLSEFNCLTKNISDLSYYSANNLGLWTFNGVKKFYISESNSDSSFIEPFKFTHSNIIKVARLDELILEPIKLLKVEAEGGNPK